MSESKGKSKIITKQSQQNSEHQSVSGSSTYEDTPVSSAVEDPTPGDRNQNPSEISFFNLIAEDFHTHDNNIFEPGFMAVFIHRFGNWRMDIRPRLIRIPFSLLYKLLHTFMTWFFGIDLGYSVKLGRRVRIWHHGGIFLGAVSIGNDVTIRHNTTMGVAHQDEKWSKPIIEDRVDIGVGVCILGDVTVGHDSVIGANSVVVRSFPPESTLFGVPARPVNLKIKK